MTNSLVVQQPKHIEGDVYHRYMTEIMQTKNEIEKKFLYLGELLFEVRELVIAGQIKESFPEFLANPDINIGRSTGENLCRIHKEFVLEFQCEKKLLAEVGVSKLVTLLENVEIDEDNVEEWLYRASATSRRDLLIEAGVTSEWIHYDGIINGLIIADEVGLLLKIQQGPPDVPPGSYRLQSRETPLGDSKTVATIKGRLN